MSFVVWGSHPRYADGTPIKLSGGTARECSAELRRLARVDNTWKAAIYPKGAAPIGLRLQAAD
jgi:hypothetical protein